MSGEAEYLLGWCGRHFIDARLFDATTDIGVPTAYCYLAAHSDSEVRQVLGCSSSRTMPRAAEKVLLETLLSRSLLCGTGELPASFKDYAALEKHSARYMAYPERSEGLRLPGSRTPASGPAAPWFASPTIQPKHCGI